MRKPNYLSPSSYAMWVDDRDKFYKTYCAPGERKRDPQTKAMAVGSAFDAYAKAFLHKALVKDNNPKFNFETLFNAQVEEHRRVQAKIDGNYVWQEYQRIGALAALMEEMGGCIGPPTSEIEINGVITSRNADIRGVPMNGRPDIYYNSNSGARVTVDWKVNGMYNIREEYHETGASPKQCFVKTLPDFKQHDKFDPVMRNGILIHNGCMSTVDVSWARQLCIYSWLLGEPVGGDFICAIDQIVCRTSKEVGKPNVRVAKHRCFISPKFQIDLFNGMQRAWYAIQNEHIFDNLTLEESQARCAMLDAPPKQVDPDFESLLRER